MLKKSLKAIITGIFAFSMLSSNLICSATEETTAITTNIPAVTSHTSNGTTMSTYNTYTTTTTTEQVTTTSAMNVTTVNSDVTTSMTTTTTPIVTTTTTTPTEMTTTITDNTTTNTIVTSLMGQQTDYIFKEVDRILYDDSLTTDEKNLNIKSYLQKKVMSNEIPITQALDITKNVKSILSKQELRQISKESINNSLDEYINSATVQNGSFIEIYCKNLIKSSFKNGFFSADETLNLLKNLHDRIFSKFPTEDIRAIADAEELKKVKSQYEDYTFTLNQSLVNQFNYTYSDLQGWIYIPNADIDYPIMQYYDNNDYYLQHDMNGFDSSQGCIELDYRCDFGDVIDTPDYTSNRLIYGHNLYNTLMFSNLENYKSQEYWENNKLIEISTTQDQRLYEIYAVCSVYGMADGTQFNYWNAKYINMDYELFEEHMALTQQTMLYPTDNFPVFGQDIITLQTCDGEDGWRLVLFAKRVK
ncbi:MAG: class B sortase [Oscillospiraceae bacterium]